MVNLMRVYVQFMVITLLVIVSAMDLTDIALSKRMRDERPICIFLILMPLCLISKDTIYFIFRLTTIKIYFVLNI